MVNVLTIAGFDPSGGAGILADIKTFEANEVYGVAVVTALTYQNDLEFNDLEWVSEAKIKRQIEIVSKRYDFDFVKIGIIENLEVLDKIVDFLKSKNGKIKIIWDPVLKASAGFDFHKSIDFKKLINICAKVYMLTPNYEELMKLFPSGNYKESAKELSRNCIVYLKSVISKEVEKISDLMFSNQTIDIFETEIIKGFEKHGSGCVLSSAITANLAKGMSLHESCKKAKEYITAFLKSSEDLTGKHYRINATNSY
ncbi:MAG: hydroxymethylpyrimidine/phosphomethylpyrimidine kinase [Bacteroidales bacterium]|nr:hydroxymethylpyrimidine/phosphomethylpyrimidine kinase [Bacteroidales bacterium]